MLKWSDRVAHLVEVDTRELRADVKQRRRLAPRHVPVMLLIRYKARHVKSPISARVCDTCRSALPNPKRPACSNHFGTSARPSSARYARHVCEGCGWHAVHLITSVRSLRAVRTFGQP
jgi:RNase P subunit RPR2